MNMSHKEAQKVFAEFLCLLCFFVAILYGGSGIIRYGVVTS
jgi:hypothetical protein